ncbi:hypothetical protein [Nguyenibacter sp. L1]|uniref:hypothetical protein n=1 Tax=Nguyenibacter sp. L1 TaxID=3049350 RepID=UPI002B46FDB9|nr:hypothetical protein [Nguyenibacter sp. L1]WRH87779.1 hypothetical protein QN315_17800 [Nguyenibacter sp. L1]
MDRVLAAGIYMSDRPSTVAHVSYRLACARENDVTQRWIALAPDGRGRFDHPGTIFVATAPAPKFALLNRILADAHGFDWVIIADDDIELAEDAVDRLLHHARTYDLALCQPARTADSFTDHPIVQVLPGVTARRTRFVEIGPFVCIRRDAARLLLPFGEDCAMGWGLDFVWPVIIENAGLRMGIVDDVTMAHRIRPPAQHYSHSTAHTDMYRLLARNPHLTHDDAFSVVEIFT